MGKYDQYDPKMREVMELLDKQKETIGELAPDEQAALEEEQKAGREAAQRLVEKAEQEASQDSASVEYQMMMNFFDTLMDDYQRREAEEAAQKTSGESKEHVGEGE